MPILDRSFAHAQNPKTIFLYSTSDQVPLIGATYRYGEQQGISSEQGSIQLQYTPDEVLQLRHLLIGTLRISGNALEEAFQTGKLALSAQTRDLAPVSVLALRPEDGIRSRQQLQVSERLHQDAGAILQADPAISGIRKSGSFGFDPVLRGFKYEQLNVVIDGFSSAAAACPNRMDPPTSQVNLSRIQSVEILKGPHALRYGIGIGGTINYQSAAPRFSTQWSTFGRVSSMVETNGGITRQEGMIGFSNARFSGGITAAYATGSDYRDGTGTSVPAQFRRGTLSTFGNYQLNERQLLSWNVQRNFARDVDFPSLPMDLRSDDSWINSLKHTLSGTGGIFQQLSTQIFYSHVDHLMDNGLRELDPRPANVRTPAITSMVGGRTEGKWRWKNHQLYAGFDLRQEEASGQREREFLQGPQAGTTRLENAWQDSRIRKAGLFTSYEWHGTRLSWTSSLRLDLNQAETRAPDGRFLELFEASSVTQWNPGLSSGMQYTLTEKDEIGFWLARVSRSGSLTERFINFFPVGLDPFEVLGNPLLKPETNHQADLVYRRQGSSLSIQVNGFAAYITDYITGEIVDIAPRLPQAPGVRQMLNIGAAFKAGGELSLIHAWHPQLTQEFRAAYTYGENTVTGEALPEIAPLDMRYQLHARWLQDRLHTQLHLRHVRGQQRVAQSFGEFESPAFTLLDLHLSYAILPKLPVKLMVHNLLDAAYFEHLNRPLRVGENRPLFEPGRNFSLSISYHW
ncbi:tonb-dependent receptor [Nitritalea halalkaliphila LW7]|uniref:Tonb-dependent receptor n=1 Tax=Nitritalea halalkaliphila LW7 TaxID=1189621 RepID=I5BTF6_9BACT|nr:TonB-dependent receptor [Nitritalea halalkaliphila]EIM72858.1 tonb-dependent receptor [Nitritalea halalkaliphila LW7]